MRAGNEPHGLADFAVINDAVIGDAAIHDTGIDDTGIPNDQPEFRQLGFVYDARESITGSCANRQRTRRVAS